MTPPKESTSSTPVADIPKADPEPETAAPTSAHAGHTPSPLQTAKLSANWRVAFIAVPAILILGGYYYFSTARMREFGDYVGKKILVSATGPSAYSSYQKAVREKGPDSSLVRSMNEKASPLLQNASRDAFAFWYKDSELSKPPEKRAPGEGGISNWDEMVQLQEWLAAIQRTPQANAQYAYARAMVALNKRNYAEARQLFEDALRNQPNWPLALNGVGKASVGMRQYDMAERFYRAASDADPSWYFPHFNLGALYRDVLRNFDASEREYRAAIQLDPGRPSFHLHLGLLYYVYGRQHWPAACSEFNLAINSRPERSLSPAEMDLAASRRNKACGASLSSL